MKATRFFLLFLGILSVVCHAAPPVVKRAKAAVSTPLFLQQPAGGNTLANVTLTATATPTKPGAPGVVAFVPPLGANGKAVLDSVSKYLVTLHQGWPAGQRIEIAFSTPVAPDDAAAAGLATATVLDAMFGGWESDPGCAVVGHLQPDGKIVAVRSAFQRLLTAMHGGAARILMPEKNVAEAAADCLVNEGPAGFGRVQMFAVKDFEEIPQMAGVKQEPLFAESIVEFDKVQKSLDAAGAEAAALLKKTDTQESLRTVLEKWPNHISARLLLGSAIGRYQTYSPAGSAQVLDRIAETLLGGVTSRLPHDVKKLPPARIDAELTALRRDATRVDPKASALVAHLIAYGEAARSWHAQPPRTVAEVAAFTKTLSAEAALAQDERQKLARAVAK